MAEEESLAHQLKALSMKGVVRLQAAPAIPLTATLASGASIPLIGLGTWKSKPGQVRDAIVHAVTKAGYRHIDAAAIYENEGEVGAALSEVFSKWDVQRSDVWVTTKIWNDSHAAAKVEPAALKSMRLLGVQYLDALLIHWPITGNRGDALSPSTKETWQALEALVDKGLVKHLGVSNFSVKKMEEIMAYARHSLSICQCESHPFFRNDGVVDFCAQRNIHFTAFSPLGSPDSADIFRRDAPVLMEDADMKAVAERTGKNVGTVLIKWALQRRPNSSVLPKSVSEARILGNAAVVDWQLSEQDMAALGGFKQTRMVHGGLFLNPAGPYRTLRDLWDTDE